MRTLQEVRNIFERSGGAMGSSGSTSYMFDKKGEIRVKGKGGNMDDEMLTLIDLGADDVEDFMDEGMQKYFVYVESPELFTMSNKITQGGFTVESSELVFKPNILMDVKDPEEAKRVLSLAEKLEENDDIHKVYANADIPEELI